MATTVRNRTTTTPTKQTSPTKTAPEVSPWASITPDETDTPIERATRSGSVLDGTPFMEWVKESHDRKKTKVLKNLPAGQARLALTLIRLAAKKLDIGVAVKPTSIGNDVTGRVTVQFRAKEKRNSTPGEAGKCPVCGKQVVISRKTGMLRQHGPINNRCAGSNKEAVPGSKHSQ